MPALHAFRARLPALLLALCGAPALAVGSCPAPARTMQEAGLVDIRGLVPEVSLDIRYFGRDNFIGAPVDGYEAPACWLKREAAVALARVEASLRRKNRRLRIFDCYRPARAVAHFMRWLEDEADTATKARFYPDLEKPALRGVYIAPQSGHSRGATLDLTLLACGADGADCVPLDMGTEFDFFGLLAHTDSPLASAAQRANRHALRAAMAAEGFVNLAEEWWHFRLEPEPAPDTCYDVPVADWRD